MQLVFVRSAFFFPFYLAVEVRPWVEGDAVKIITIWRLSGTICIELTFTLAAAIWLQAAI